MEKCSPFVLSIDGMLGREALVLLATLSRLMVAKIYKPILHVRGWINGRIIITVEISYPHIISGDRLTIHLQDRVPVWDSALGLGFAH